MEAFKPGTGPPDTYSVIGMDSAAFTGAPSAGSRVTPQLERSLQPGGLY
jgi:hypothetical protein